MRIAITGTEGFIGNATGHYLKSQGHEIYPVDFNCDRSSPLCSGFNFTAPETLIEMIKEGRPEWTEREEYQFDAIVHLGANTDTLCQDKRLLDRKNSNFTKLLWDACAKRRIRFIYASSAATYGDGSQGFEDDTEKLSSLKPLNPYAESKHVFDLYAVKQAKKQLAPPNWAGLKFYNVYGKTEASKGRMASMVYKLYHQAKDKGKVTLFKHGEQKRDWVHVDDVIKVIDFMLNYHCYSIYNVGSEQARSFNDVADVVFNTLGKTPNIEYVDMPESLVPAYQGFSQANMTKLKNSFKNYAGKELVMKKIEEGIPLLSNI